MLAGSIVVALALSHAAAALPATAESDAIEVTAAESRVGYEALIAGDNARAIAEIEGNRALAQDDPARLINLGIAHARLGNVAQAEELFHAAVASGDQMELETSTGDWVYSRAIARLALRMLDQGDLRMARIAVR